MDTLYNDAFPSLKIENTLFVSKLFDQMQLELDFKTKLLPFDPFIQLLCGFRSKTIEDKIERFFKIIDEDGNGTLSYEEMRLLVNRSLLLFKDAG